MRRLVWLLLRFRCILSESIQNIKPALRRFPLSLGRIFATEKKLRIPPFLPNIPTEAFVKLADCQAYRFFASKRFFHAGSQASGYKSHSISWLFL
jgi:hypothetical protein